MPDHAGINIFTNYFILGLLKKNGNYDSIKWPRKISLKWGIIFHHILYPKEWARDLRNVGHMWFQENAKLM